MVITRSIQIQISQTCSDLSATCDCNVARATLRSLANKETAGTLKG